MLPGAFFISACSKGGGYNLKNLSKDFYSVAEDDKDNIVKNGNKLTFYYSNYTQNNETYVADLVNDSSSVYSNIKNYNLVYENILNFTFEYVDVCSNNEIEIDKEVKNSLEEKMNNLHLAIKNVDVNVDLLAGSLKTTPKNERKTNVICLSKFKDLLISYEDLFGKATEFNAELANIYYNYIVTNSNPNVEEINPASFDSSDVINKLDSRISLQISNLSSAFAEKYIIDSNVAEQVVAGTNLNLNPTNFEYLTMVGSINVNIAEDVAIQIANGEAKLAFYQTAKKAYVAQEWLAENNSKFIYSCVNADYAKINLNNCSANEEVCVNIINDYTTALFAYNNILIEMLDII